MDEEPNPDFPRPIMPRMGRRNAIIAAQEPLPLFGAIQAKASTPDNPNSRETVANKPAKPDRVKQMEGDTKVKTVTIAPIASPTNLETEDGVPPTNFNASVLKEWKKLQDSNSKADGISSILKENAHAFAVPTTAKGKKFRPKSAKATSSRSRTRSVSSDKGNAETAEIKSTAARKPWRKSGTPERPATSVEERRKVFQSFNLTSLDPPETPHISEQKLKRSVKNFRSELSPNVSEESLIFPSDGRWVTKGADSVPNKGQFANVLPKVNTRWSRWESINNWKLNSVLNTNIDRTASKGLGLSKPSGIGKFRETLPPPAPRPTSAAETSKGDRKKSDNYPQMDPAKNHPGTDKLPLTIGPRFNHKKAWKTMTPMNPEVRSAMKGVRERFQGSNPSNAFSKGKFEPLTPSDVEPRTRGPPRNEMSPFKSTFFNLQRINNGSVKAGPTNAAPGVRGNAQATGRHPHTLLNFDNMGMGVKVPPILTTIQSPPDPFLTSNVSVSSQANGIPIRGEAPESGKALEKYDKNMAKKEAALQKKGNATAGKAAPVALKENQKKGESPKAVTAPPPPTARKDTPKKVAPTVPKVTEKSKGAGGTHSPARSPSFGRPPVRPTTPTKRRRNSKLAARRRQKYDNIFIGPYSGSESEMEQKNNSKKKRA